MLHAKGPSTVIITSAEFAGEGHEGFITLIGSTRVRRGLRGLFALPLELPS